MNAIITLRVLVVDDDEGVVAVLERWIRQAGHTVATAGSAEEALACAQSWSPDLVVSDICMSGLSGTDLVERLRRQRVECEIVLMTGNASLDTAISALRGRVLDYLIKPITRARLLQILDIAMERCSRERRLQAGLAMVKAGLQQIVEHASPARAPEAAGMLLPAAGQYRIGPICLDAARRKVEVDGQIIDLTPTEFDVLHCLLQQPDQVASPEDLLRAARSYAAETWEAREIVRTHISNLRRKLLAASPGANVIVTVRSQGYRLQAPPADSTASL